jgi:hypothetical protein
VIQKSWTDPERRPYIKEESKKEKQKKKKPEHQIKKKERERKRRHLPKATLQIKPVPPTSLPKQRTTWTGDGWHQTLGSPHPPDANHLQVDQRGMDMAKKSTPRPRPCPRQ